MAAFMGRAFMVTPDAQFDAYMHLRVDADWGRHAALYGDLSRVPTCEAFFNQFQRQDLDWCADGQPRNATLMWYSSSDYDLPLLQISPVLQQHMRRLLPSGDWFYHVSSFLLQPSEKVLQALAPYTQLAGQCAVGVHLRSKKKLPGEEGQEFLNIQQFARVVASLAEATTGNIFVASDHNNFDELARLLPDRRVWWSKETAAAIGQETGAAGDNPGSDLSALIDIFLLARCQQIVLTAGSSFGTMAAGIANKHPVHVLRGDHARPFLNPWFWGSTTSEPCMWKAGRTHPSWMSKEIREALRQRFSGFLYHEQCN